MTYDQAFLNVTNSFRSPNELGQSRGFASPSATLTAPYAAFACSRLVHVRNMCTQVNQNRVEKVCSARLIGTLTWIVSVQEP